MRRGRWEEVIAIRWDVYESELLKLGKEIAYYLQKSGASRSDSEDIAQDVLVKLLASDLVLPYDKLRAWLYRTAIRSYIDKYRRDKRYHDLIIQDFFPKSQQSLYDQADYAFVHEAVAALKPKLACLLDSYYFQGFSVKECASILGMSQSQVKVNLYRGRQALKKILVERGYHHEDI